MNEYLKMADVFCGEAQADADLLFDDDISNIADFSGYKTHCRYAAHAINNHDALVSDVERLRVLLGDCKDLIESLGFKHGFGSNDINNVLNSIDLELSKK